MAIVWGLGAALGFGVADFFARAASQREGIFRAAFYLHFAGAVVGMVPFLFGVNLTWQAVVSLAGLKAMLIGIIAAVGVLLFYRALVLGPLLVVSPIASSAAVVTVALALLTGERPAALQLVGMGITITGVILAAAATQNINQAATQRRSLLSPGVALAILTAILFGYSTWLLDSTITELGNLTTILILRVAAFVVLLFALLVRKSTPLVSSISSFKWLLPMAVLDNIATWSLTLGLQNHLTSIVAVTASLFSVVTVLLGYILLKERISRSQQIGVATTIVGVVLVNV